MAEYEQILKVKEDAEARLRAIPGVHAVGISRKVVGGKSSGELCITVFLVEKKPLDRLAPEAVVPPELDGVPTDVVEMEIPRLLMASANLRPQVQGLSVTFEGNDPPGRGLLVVLSCTFGPTGSPPGPPSYILLETKEMTSLTEIAQVFATKINRNSPENMTAGRQPLGFTAAPPTSPLLTLIPNAGNFCAITDCIVIPTDYDSHDYLSGGIQIQAGGADDPGTLGFLATTPPTADEPQGKVVAITCQHVVDERQRLPTNLTSTATTNTITFTQTGTEPIVKDTLVTVRFTDVPGVESAVAFYATRPGDTLDQVAIEVADAIVGMGLSGLTSYAVDPVVTVTGGTPQCDIYGPRKQDDDLHADVAGLDIDLTGNVSGDNYGIFTHINRGGVYATFGSYRTPAKKAKLDEVGDDISRSISFLLPDATRADVQAVASGGRVSLFHAQEIECVVRRDRQVGQPDNDFGSTCSHCCSHRIGRVLDSRIDVDAAIVQLDPKQKYKPEIVDFGPLTGFHPPLLDGDLSLAVLKRGKTTRLTHGVVTALNKSGVIVNRLGFHRQYTNAIHVATSVPNTPFSASGDSGAAVFTADGKVVGILFGGTGLSSLITPIEQVRAVFSTLALNVAPAPAAGQAPGDVRIVPKSAMAAVAPLGQAATSPGAFFGERLVEAEREITATPAGSELAGSVKLHFAEAYRLVNSNRRVATVWHRSGGPQIVQAMLGLVHRRDQRLPEEIDGRPFAECLERIKNVLARYGSPALAADLSWLAPRLKGFSGCTYAEVLSALQAGGAE